jgi:acetyl/propionyl-CoA carboxylase alpha subunit
MHHPKFKTGQFDTHFVKKHFKKEYLEKFDEQEAEIAAILANHLHESSKSIYTTSVQKKSVSSWKENRR